MDPNALIYLTEIGLQKRNFLIRESGNRETQSILKMGKEVCEKAKKKRYKKPIEFNFVNFSNLEFTVHDIL